MDKSQSGPTQSQDLLMMLGEKDLVILGLKRQLAEVVAAYQAFKAHKARKPLDGAGAAQV